MADKNPSPQPRAKISRIPVIILVFLVLFSFILILWPQFANIGVVNYNSSAFETNVVGNSNAYITALVVSPYEEVVSIKGQYYEFSANTNTSDRPITFTVTYTKSSYDLPSSVDSARYDIDLSQATTSNTKVYFDETSGKDAISIGTRLEREVVYSQTATQKWTGMKYLTPDSFGYAYNSEKYQTDYTALLLQMSIYGILICLAWIAISFLIQSISQASGRGADPTMNFNTSRARRVTKSNVRFDQVAGCEEEKAELVEVVEYLKNPRKFTDFGAKLPKGILLVGPPGTGKTLLAKATAGEAGVPFFSISGSDFVEMFVGVGAGRVRDMFKKAKQSAPCIVFIDEIDAVGRQRGAGLGGGNDEREQTLNQLLVEMDGFSDNSGVVVIAATNREDVLDPALLRAGRFDRQITVNLPDKEGREAIFKVHARNKKFAAEVDFAQLSKRTVGFSGADIENILNEAAILAVRGSRTEITMNDIDEAIDRRIAGPAKKSKGMSVRERKTVAYHEAGHAIIGLKVPHSDIVQKITIIPRGRTGGHVLMTPEDDRFLLTKKELISRIIGYLGGRSSEEIFFDDVSTGAQNDIEVATRIARVMVTEYGMSSLGPIQYEQASGSVFLGRDYTSSQRNFSQDVANEIDREVRKIIEEAHKEAKRVITKYKDDVILIAETLLENETITAEEIDFLLKNRRAPKKGEINTTTKVEELTTVAEVNKVEETLIEKPKRKTSTKKTTADKKDSAAPKKKATTTKKSAPKKKEESK